MLVTLFQTDDDFRVINKVISNKLEIEGSLRSSLEVDTIIFSLNTDRDISAYNYLKINDKFYFLDTKTMISTGVYNIEATIDLLETYKTNILKLDAVIVRSEKTYNRYLPDNNLRPIVYPRVQTKRFSNSFIPAGSAVMIVTGG